MKVVILAYEDSDIWDIAIPYEIFRKLPNCEVELACEKESGEITLRDKNLEIGGLNHISKVGEPDILWIASGEANIKKIMKDDVFKIHLARLCSASKKVFALGASSSMLIDIIIDKSMETATHPSFVRMLKSKKGSYSQDLMVENGKFISSSSRVSCIYALMLIINEFFGPEIRDDVFQKHNFDKQLLYRRFGGNNQDKYKLQKKLYKQTVKRKKNPKQKEQTIDTIEDSIGIYLYKGSNVLNFAAYYSILSNYQKFNMYIISDKAGDIEIEGGGFFVRASHSLHRVKRIHTLVLCGGDFVEDKLNDSFIKYWISEIVPKVYRVISFDSADRLLGASGALRDFDPAHENVGGKFLVFDDLGQTLNWIKNNLSEMTNETQAKLYFSEYY